ncbi:MAG: carboxypeptidase regulatory-like domain-containing protein [Planctomycetes bacterium]|nr:carboxypeptidase regulatory-like domain-containing protein [Planctomycetota bacterium]
MWLHVAAALGIVGFATPAWATNVCGNITQDTVWDLAGSPYVLTCNVTVLAGVTLTIESGVEVQTNSNYSLGVYGYLNVAGATFTGTYTKVIVYSAGVADLAGCLFTAGYVNVATGSTTTIAGCELPQVYLSGGLPTVTGSTLTGTRPIYITDPDCASGLGGFSGNTYTASDPKIWIFGQLNGTATLPVVDGLHKYDMYSNNNLQVNAGGQLTIEPGVELQMNDNDNFLLVYGDLQATGATFSGAYARVIVYSAGVADLAGCLFTAGYVQFASGSTGTVGYCQLVGLYVHSGANASIAYNDLSSAHAYSDGTPTATIALESNWWGTTDPVQIAAKITDHYDDPSRPYVDFMPFLLEPPIMPYTFAGLVAEVDAQGHVVRPVAGASVSLAGGPAATTNSQGQFQLVGVQPGAYTATVTKSGYYPVSRVVYVLAGESQYEVFHLISTSGGDVPVAFDFTSPNGNHFIEGMPGNLTFETTVAWNGSPGSVRFEVNGTWYVAGVEDLGGGLARATVTVLAPDVIGACSELTIEVTNGEGHTQYVNTGVHFSPIPGIIIPWYQDNIPWTPSGLTLSYSDEMSFHWELPFLGTDDLEFEVYAGWNRGLSYDLLGATFSGSLGGFGGFGLDWEITEVEILASGQLNVAGALAVSFAGCNPPVITPSWEIGFSGKAGVGAPAILIVDVIFPPAAPAVHGLLAIPVVGDVVGALKLRLFLVGGASLSGEYEGGQWGECFLGTTELTVAGKVGIEGAAVVELFGAEAGVYAGGQGGPELEICPDLQLQAITFGAYVGVFAHVWFFEFSEEVGAEVRFDLDGKRALLGVPSPDGKYPVGEWRPIGKRPLRWGSMNRLVGGRGPVKLLKSDSLRLSGGSREEFIVENVTKVAKPSLMADPDETLILFALHDPNKPWYASTDIGTVRSLAGEPWTMGRIADDQQGEFSPWVSEVDAAETLAAWTRVTGDVSGAQGPEDIAPHLDIAAGWLDRDTGVWSMPDQLTSNGQVDRDPAALVFGATKGIVWVQNEAGDTIGNATNGDQLLFARWSGSNWEVPETLWSDQQGIVGLSWAPDTAGEGHVVFVVDEDGDPETRPDRELYWASTVAGVWQTPSRMTNDAVEDALPTLVAPDGEPLCVWSSGGTLLYSVLGTWNPQPVYAAYTISNEAPSLAGLTMPGGAAVAYTAQAPEGVDVVVAFYDAALDTWSLPRQLTQDEHVETSLSLAWDGAELTIAYLKTQTDRNEMDIEIEGEMYHLVDVPQPARTDLCLLRHGLGYDLAVAANSLTLDPANPAPEAAVTIAATIENRGDLPVSDLQVAFYDGHPSEGGTLIGTTQIIAGWLIAGDSREITVPWVVPADAMSHEIFVVVDPDLLWDDRDRSNNEVSLWSVLPDLAIENVRSEIVSSTSMALIARVVNLGTIGTDQCDLTWRAGAQDGQLIGTTRLPQIEAGAAYEVAFISDAGFGGTRGEYLQVYAAVDAADEMLEFDETNNTSVQSVQLPMTVAGDLDGDGDVDLDDFELFAGCMAGPGVTTFPPECDIFDFVRADGDADGDLDLRDFAAFQAQFTGAQP